MIFRSTINPPGQLWQASRVGVDRVLLEPVNHMDRPTTDSSARSIEVSRRVAETYFGPEVLRYA